MRFADWLAGDPLTPYLVAEIGVNHGGSLSRAKRQIDQAAAGGADAVKLQAYKAERLVALGAPTYFRQTGEEAQTQREFFRRYDRFEISDYVVCAAHAREHGLDFLCTPFDAEWAALLAPLVPAWKVASGDLTNWPLLDQLAADGKPMIISTGGATWDEIGATYERLAPRVPAVVLLHCMLAYPTERSDAQLATLRGLADRWPKARLGYSDHTFPTPHMQVCTIAYALGARLIEKHFTDDRRSAGNDHYHSMEREELLALRTSVTAVREMLGTGDRAVPFAVEAEGRLAARRSWHAARALPLGHSLTAGDAVPKRPGHGIPPTVPIEGRVLQQRLDVDQAITEAHLA